MTYDRAYAEHELGANCSECPLRVGGRFVPSVGPANADLAFVGEAPGTHEVHEGRPFVGPSGRLLKLVTSKHHINTEEAFLTNACLCRAADGKTPPKAALAACKPRLLKELGNVQPGVVVAMGNSAASSVLGLDGVTRLRVGPGRASPYPQLHGARVITTVHPAACLRQSDMFPSLVTDIGKVVTRYEPWSEPEYEVANDPVDAVNRLKEVERRADDLVLDIEVDIDKDTSFDHPDRYGLLCIGLAWQKGHALVIGERASQDGHVRDAMADAFAASRIICQNGKFDLAGLTPVLGPLKLYFDTMLASYCLDERGGIHGLEHLAIEHLGAPSWKKELDQYGARQNGYGVVPRDVLYRYNAYDASCTYDLSQVFARRLDAQGLRGLHDFLVEASNELMFLELNGLAVDRDYISTLWKEYQASLDQIDDELNQILVDSGFTGPRLNPRSPIQVRKALLHFRVRTDSVDKDHVAKIVDILEKRNRTEEPLYRFLEVYKKQQREQKLFGTYVKGTAKRTFRGRVYPTFMLHGTTTGRLSCRNPNLQNVPRESAIKRLFIPGKPGNVFVQADYAQAELRVLTWLARDPYFREILNDPSRDLFDELTPILYPNLPSKEEVGPGRWKDIRVRVKAFVYGLNYGRTEYSIAAEYKLPVDEAKAVKKRFFNTIPTIVEWQAGVQKQVWDGNDLINPFGRHRRFHLVTKDNWDDIKKEALAFLPQSTSSDICLRAMVRVRRDLRGTGAYIRNIVHDSILVDCPEDMAGDVGRLLDKHMVDSATDLVEDYVSFRTDITTGHNWGEV